MGVGWVVSYTLTSPLCTLQQLLNMIARRETTLVASRQSRAPRAPASSSKPQHHGMAAAARSGP
jgi:hypothetical protein